MTHVESAPLAAASGTERNGASPPPSVVLCRNCQTPSSADRRFCGNCGQPLWESCPSCAAQVMLAETFCGSCGVNIAGATQAQLAKCHAALDSARELRQQCRYDEALALMNALVEMQQPRLRELAFEARGMVEAITAERVERLAEAAAAHAEAQRLASERQFDRARCALEAIPPALRSEEVADMLDGLTGYSREITDLDFEIRKAVQAKETYGLLAKVERYLELKPDATPMRKLAEQLRNLQQNNHVLQCERLCRSAKESLAAGNYDHALEQLGLVPEAAWNTSVESLHEQATELAWLARELRHSPVVDAALIAIAERLVKLHPEHPAAAKHLVELRKRSQSAPQNRRLAAPAWAKPPVRTLIGYPLEWVGGFARIACAPGVQASLAQHPGRFHVAVGLALQGLDLAHIGLNLAIEEKRGVLGLLGQRKRRQKAKAAWGIDLSPTGLKAIKLVTTATGVTIEACEFIEHEKHLNRPEAELERNELLAAAVRQLCERHELKGERVCLGLPGSKVLSRALKLPPVPAEKLPDVVTYETRMQIPLPLDTLQWDYRVMKTFENTNHGNHEVLAAAVQRSEVRSICEVFAPHKVQVEVVQSDCIALHNLLMYDYLQFEPAASGAGEGTVRSTGGPIGVIDLGAGVTNVVIAAADAYWSRSIGRGSDEINKVLMRQFNLTFAKAELLKRAPALARSISKVGLAMEDVFVDLFQEIQRSLAAYANDNDGRGPERIICLGGGLQTHGLLRHLQMGRID